MKSKTTFLKSKALFQLCLLIASTIAFSWSMGEVSGQTYNGPGTVTTKTGAKMTLKSGDRFEVSNGKGTVYRSDGTIVVSSTPLASATFSSTATGTTTPSATNSVTTPSRSSSQPPTPNNPNVGTDAPPFENNNNNPANTIASTLPAVAPMLAAAGQGQSNTQTPATAQPIGAPWGDLQGGDGFDEFGQPISYDTPLPATASLTSKFVPATSEYTTYMVGGKPFIVKTSEMPKLEAGKLTPVKGLDASGEPIEAKLAPDAKGSPTTNAQLAAAGLPLAPTPTAQFLSNLGSGIWQGLIWAGIAFGIGQLIGNIAGMDSDQTMALSTALAAGAFVGKGLYTMGTFGGEGFWGLGPEASAGLVGLAVAAIVFMLLYEDVDVEAVTFTCMPWEAPVGGSNCEKCNSDTLPCSEYKCRSLGQNCEIVNPGTSQEKCVNVNPNDVNPPIITPNEKDLSFGHKYSNVKLSPPGPGFTITNTGSSDGCLKAYTPLKFGVTTNEPSQCKLDFNHTTTFDEMKAYMGGNSYYLYNHTEQFKLPNAREMANSSFTLQNGKDLVFYLRCRDKSGNMNEAEYALKFCIDPSPDTTPPKIMATSINNSGCIAEGVTSGKIEFYTNEPADCKWSPEDKDYDQMQNTMVCNNQLYQMNAEQLFACSANLTGISKDSSKFFVRCKDQPGREENKRNKMGQSYEFSLRGSTALKLKNVHPNSTVFAGVSPAPIELYAETIFGCSNGRSICFYSQTGKLNDYIMFYDTNKVDGIHTQRLDVISGNYQYFVKCIDEGGNVAETKTQFTVEIDTSAPTISRIYQDDTFLKIITTRTSQCSYSFKDCDFTLEEGTDMPYANSSVHVVEWAKDKTFYIKCRDEFRNEPAECSAIVRPTTNFL